MGRQSSVFPEASPERGSSMVEGERASEDGVLFAPDSPRGDGILDVVAGGIDKYPTLVPCPTLDADVLVNVTQSLQFAVTDHNSCKRQRA